MGSHTRAQLGSVIVTLAGLLLIGLLAPSPLVALDLSGQAPEKGESVRPGPMKREAPGPAPAPPGASPTQAPPSLVLSDGGVEFPDGTVQETSATAPLPPTALVVVDCALGDSVSEALQERARELTIEIAGICDEHVVIERSDVTLRGTDPSADGLRGVPGTSAPVVKIRHSSNISIENLGVYDGERSGIDAEGAIRLFIENSRVVGHVQVGVGVDLGGLVRINGSEISGDLWGVASSGEIACDGCTIHGNSAAWVAFAGQQTLRTSTVTSDDLGVWAQLAATLNISDTSISSVNEAVVAWGNARISLARSTVEGGNVYCTQQSSIAFWNTQQTSLTSGANTFEGDCWAHVADGSALLGVQVIDLMSKMTIVDTSTVEDLACAQGSDAFCEDPAVNVTGSSDCGQCQ